jgi:hypothetical protein
MANPLVNIINNYTYGKNLLTGKEGSTLEGSTSDTLRPWTTVKSLFWDEDGGFGLNSGNSDWTEKLVRVILGVPVYKQSDKRVESAQNERDWQMGKYVNETLQAQMPEGYKIFTGSTNGNQVIKIATTDKDGKAKTIVLDTSNVQDAIDWINAHE